MKNLTFAAIVSVAALVGAPAAAETFDNVNAGVDSRLTKSLAELASVRERISKEKIPLSKAVNQLEAEVLALRREHERLLEVRDSRTIDLTSLRAEVKAEAQQDEFVQSRLKEFVHDFGARLDISEMPLYEATTSAAELAEKDVNLDAGARRGRQIDVVKAAITRLSQQLGGQIFDGNALSPEGVLTEGRFIAVGPTVFYASNDGRVAGLVENQLNAADPVVVPLPGGLGEKIAEIAANGRGTLPFDATLGKALKLEKSGKSLFDRIEDGGPVGAIIIALGVTALAIAGFKAREIMAFPVAEPEEVDAVLSELAKGNDQAAVWQAGRIPGVAGSMLATGVEHSKDKRGVLEELLFEEILKVRPTLERFLPFLAITAATAPLLGLLGTVTGMIKTFQLITVFGTGDAKSLSSGISEALVTTAEGLIVAIPALIIHGALSRMAKQKLGMLEQLSVAFVNGVASIRHSSGD